MIDLIWLRGGKRRFAFGAFPFLGGRMLFKINHVGRWGEFRSHMVDKKFKRRGALGRWRSQLGKPIF